MPSANLDLFSDLKGCSIPPGFRYAAYFIDSDEEAALVTQIQRLNFAPYEFRGVQARRRVVSFGLRHGYQTPQLMRAQEIPSFLKTLQAKAAIYAGLAPDGFSARSTTKNSTGPLVVSKRPAFPP